MLTEAERRQREYLVAEVTRTEREYRTALADVWMTVVALLFVLALIVLAGSVAPVGH